MKGEMNSVVDEYKKAVFFPPHYSYITLWSSAIFATYSSFCGFPIGNQLLLRFPVSSMCSLNLEAELFEMWITLKMGF